MLLMLSLNLIRNIQGIRSGTDNVSALIDSLPPIVS